MAIITDTKARNIKPEDKAQAHGGVTGLWLMPAGTKGCGKWTLRFVSPLSGKRRDMGLGCYPEVSIAQAGKTGAAARELLALGLDPIEQRNLTGIAEKEKRNRVTFRQAALQLHSDLCPGWKNPKHAAQWINTLETYIFSCVGDVAVEELTPKHFAEALRPIWLSKTETAKRVKQRCHAVMAWCWAHGLVSANPLDVIDYLLPKQTETAQHHPAMPFGQVALFIRTELLQRKPSECAKPALMFLILTAARSGAVRLMTWAEVDFRTATWTIPADTARKTNVPRRIPLSVQALALLEQQKAAGLHATLVFPSPRGKALSDMTLTVVANIKLTIKRCLCQLKIDQGN